MSVKEDIKELKTMMRTIMQAMNKGPGATTMNDTDETPIPMTVRRKASSFTRWVAKDLAEEEEERRLTE